MQSLSNGREDGMAVYFLTMYMKLLFYPRIGLTVFHTCLNYQEWAYVLKFFATEENKFCGFFCLFV